MVKLDNVVEGVGPVPCQGMIVGEAPGVEEERERKPFVGKSGKRLEEALMVAGLDRKKVYITNTYKSRPPGNRTPTEREVSAHSMMLHRELSSVRPKYILTLGIVATNAFLYSDKSITQMRGKTYKTGDFVVMPTFHPAYTLYDGSKKEVFIEDVGRFVTNAFKGGEKGE